MVQSEAHGSDYRAAEYSISCHCICCKKCMFVGLESLYVSKYPSNNYLNMTEKCDSLQNWYKKLCENPQLSGY